MYKVYKNFFFLLSQEEEEILTYMLPTSKTLEYYWKAYI